MIEFMIFMAIIFVAVVIINVIVGTIVYYLIGKNK